MSRSSARADAALLLPAALCVLLLLGAPVLLLLRESFLPVVDGRVADAGWTGANYRALADPAYAFYFYDTLRFAALAATLAALLAMPLARICARTPSAAVRRAILLLLVGTLFMSSVARIYALQASFVRTGPLAFLPPLLGIRSGSPQFAAFTVTLGLVHFVLPAMALTMVGTFAALDPRLEEAAGTLGASRGRVLLDVVLPLALPGLLGAWTLGFAMGVSNFVIPLLLGRGVVVFVTNLIYVRVSQIADFASGAALAVLVLLAVSVLLFGLLRLLGRPLQAREPRRA